MHSSTSTGTLVGSQVVTVKGGTGWGDTVIKEHLGDDLGALVEVVGEGYKHPKGGG